MEQVKTKIGHISFDHADYDADSDVLYLHVGEPQEAEGEETPEGHVLDRDGELRVTIPESVKATADDLAPALAAV